MKCPKCGYLGFEPVERCRNCGYDFSLATPEPPDLTLRSAGDSLGPLDELPLADPAAAEGGNRLTVAASATASRDRAQDRKVPAADLPLFGDVVDDTPLITRTSPPRQPLAVRRATPEIPRLRTESRSMPLDLAPPELVARSAPRIEPRDEPVPAEVPAAATEQAASIARRVVAGALDLVALLAIDALVIYFTLQISGLPLAEMALLPAVPLLTFLLLLAGGYVTAFTAGGQTLGQMALGVRVVSMDTGRPPALGIAFLRTVVLALLLAPGGLGLASIVLDEQGRGLHDRFASTRVIRADA